MTSDASRPTRRHWSHLAAAVFALALTVAPDALAQVRERLVAFDSTGRMLAITPPLASRLGLAAPLWPVTGDYVDARLYSLDDSSAQFVIVVRRPREVLERHPLAGPQRRELGAAIDRANALAIAATGLGADSMPTFISEPVRGSFVLNQTALGVLLFGPSAAALIADPAGSTAAYLAVMGGSFFLATDLTRNTSVSRAQNHLSFHSALRGGAAARLGLHVLAGDDVGSRAAAGSFLVGGILGDIAGFRLARPMTDAEAHGTAHGSTVGAGLALGLSGMAGAFSGDGGSRAAAGAVIVAGALGYPAGLRYVRKAPYRVTAGDVGTLLPSELLGMGLASTLFVETDVGDEVAFAALTAGFLGGAFLGDRLLVRPYDHTEGEARLLAFGTAAGAVIGLAAPILASAENGTVILGAATVGGVLGAILTEGLIQPARAEARTRTSARGAERKAPRVSVQLSPGSVVLAGFRQPGRHSIVSMVF